MKDDLFLDKYNINCNILSVLGIISAINIIKSQFDLINLRNRLQYPILPMSIEPLMRTKKGSKYMYTLLIKE